MKPIHLSLGLARLVRVFLEDAGRARYGYDLMRVTGFPSGKLYPMLARLEAAGWLVKEVEDIDPAVAGRPRRRMYRLSPDGAEAARIRLAELSAELRPPRAEGAPAPRLRGGAR